MSKEDRSILGRSLFKSAQKLKERLAAFYGWLPVAIGKVQGNHLELILDGEHIVAIETPFGRMLLEEEFVRRGDQLVVRVLFCQPPSLCRTHAKVVYAVELHENEMAYFGKVEPFFQFDWDHATDTWASRNVLRLAYELAIACTEPHEDIR